GVPRSGSIAWRDLGFVVLHFDSQISFGQSHTGIKSVEIRGVDSDGAEVMLGRWDGDVVFDKNALNAQNQFLEIATTRPPKDPPQPTVLDRLSADERSARARLIAHLNSNKAYYYRQIWMSENPNARLIRLGRVIVTIGGNGLPLFDAVENRV